MGEVKCNKMFRKCDKRISHNQYGDDMCGAIGCCEVGDMPCECLICNRECDKQYDLHCFNVHCKDAYGNEYDVGVMSYDVDSAMKSAEYSLKEGRHIVAVAEWCKGASSI